MGHVVVTHFVVATRPHGKDQILPNCNGVRSTIAVYSIMTSDAYQQAVTIGERVPHNATIALVPYDAHWPAAYSGIAEEIRAVLGEAVMRIEHVGSTSVPGLSAKPVIDIVLAVADSTDEASYVPALEGQGFVLRIREPHWFEHRLLKAPTPVAGNVHVFSAGCVEIDRMIAFRDRLRTNTDDRTLYEETKRRLAAQVWEHVQHYADAKSTVIRGIIDRIG